jgi:hypothetical protein
VSKVIPYSQLARQQQLNYLNHQGREYREREEYLGRVRQLLFQAEAQMRLAEMQQLQVFREMAEHFKIPLAFPDLGDRLELQQLFDSHPLLLALKEFFAGRLSAEECCQKITALQDKSTAHPEE